MTRFTFDDVELDETRLQEFIKEIRTLVMEQTMTNSKREIIQYNLDTLSSFIEQVFYLNKNDKR